MSTPNEAPTAREFFQQAAVAAGIGVIAAAANYANNRSAREQGATVGSEVTNLQTGFMGIVAGSAAIHFLQRGLEARRK